MTKRLRSLDGLRGLAALVVVFHHSLLTDKIFAAPYGGWQGGQFPSAAWWLTSTPLHLLWGGSEAVYVFFVLSGLVLTRAAVRHGFAWRGYYRARLVRLYLPAWGALAFGALLYELVPRTLSRDNSWWVNRHANALLFLPVRNDVLLVRTPDWLVSPLWSLKWEILFSAVLPLAVYGALRRPRLALVEAAALVPLVWLGDHTGHESLVFLPMFGLGALVAVHFETLGAFAAGLSGGAWAATACVAGVLLTASWTWGGGRWLETIGALLVVLLFAFCPRVRGLGEGRRAQWLGTRSFSLYLVHEPIVVSVALLLGASWTTILFAVPLSLVAAHVFHRVVEAPCHRVARALSDVSKHDVVVQPTLGSA